MHVPDDTILVRFLPTSDFWYCNLSHDADMHSLQSLQLYASLDILQSLRSFIYFRYSDLSLLSCHLHVVLWSRQCYLTYLTNDNRSSVMAPTWHTRISSVLCRIPEEHQRLIRVPLVTWHTPYLFYDVTYSTDSWMMSEWLRLDHRKTELLPVNKADLIFFYKDRQRQASSCGKKPGSYYELGFLNESTYLDKLPLNWCRLASTRYAGWRPAVASWYPVQRKRLHTVLY